DWLDINPRNADKFVDICLDAPLWTTDHNNHIDHNNHTDHDNHTDHYNYTDEKAADTGAKTAERQPLPFIDMSNWDDEPVPELEWAVLDRIPLHKVTLFSGEGSAGKSTTQLHLSFAHALGRDWLGTMPELGPALFIDAEDDEKILHRRSAAILNHYQCTF